jgi:hypothetical protein
MTVTTRSVSLLLALLTAPVLLPRAGAQASLSRADTTGDGVEEIVITNPFLRVEVMTGENPADGTRARYDERFVWAGWINAVEFVPDGTRPFDHDTANFWCGIPEEFERAVPMATGGDGRVDCLKVGVGRCDGRGNCTRAEISLRQPVEWQIEEQVLEDGTARVAFSHRFTTELGFAYGYTKAVSLAPDTSVLRVTRTLENLGSKRLVTNWYSHAFWAQAADGSGYDRDCWSTVPVILGHHGQMPVVNTDSCQMTVPSREGVWGAIPAEVIADSWYAVGNRATGMVAFNQVSHPLAWFRVWTYLTTYSIEPFVMLDLGPGETRTWVVERTFGNGLTSVRGACELGLVDWRFTGPDGGRALELGFLPNRELENAELTVRISREDGWQRLLPGRDDRFAVTGAPDKPWTARVPGPFTNGTYRVEVSVHREDAPVTVVHALEHLGPDTPLAQRPVRDDQTEAPILLVVPQALPPDTPTAVPRDAAYLFDYLDEAGFSPEPIAIADLEARMDTVPRPRALVLCGTPAVGSELVARLEGYVASGGGLLCLPPIPSASFEFSSLLPVVRVTADVNLQQVSPRDGTFEFQGVSGHWRYHLTPSAPHPILRGLPLFPAAYQDIARLQVVAPRPNAQTLLAYTAPQGIGMPRVDSPALLVHDFGRGRVAVFCSPADWGLPASWVIFSRTGEYHRRFLVQLTAWTARTNVR